MLVSSNPDQDKFLNSIPFWEICLLPYTGGKLDEKIDTTVMSVYYKYKATASSRLA